jgi:hypothetical protein
MKLSIHPSRHPSRHPYRHPSKQNKYIFLKREKTRKINKNRKTLLQLETFFKHLNMKQKREIQ